MRYSPLLIEPSLNYTDPTSIYPASSQKGKNQETRWWIITNRAREHDTWTLTRQTAEYLVSFFGIRG